jgi:hypothetical protein
MVNRGVGETARIVELLERQFEIIRYCVGDRSDKADSNE